MINNVLGAAALAAALAVSHPALARAPAPLLPAALVEDVKSATADVEFMDYVGNGQVIKLESSDVLVLSYLKSCVHETIAGGTVHVGRDQSNVDGGKVVRNKVACNGGNMKLVSQQANVSAASSFRLQNADLKQMVYALPPIIQIPKLRADEPRTLVIERMQRPSERVAIELDESLVNGGPYDFGKADVRLQRGALYTVTLGSRKLVFQVDAKAATGKAPVVSRLLRFLSD
jgi:hypothetical protein